MLESNGDMGPALCTPRMCWTQRAVRRRFWHGHESWNKRIERAGYKFSVHSFLISHCHRRRLSAESSSAIRSRKTRVAGLEIKVLTFKRENMWSVARWMERLTFDWDVDDSNPNNAYSTNHPIRLGTDLVSKVPSKHYAQYNLQRYPWSRFVRKAKIIEYKINLDWNHFGCSLICCSRTERALPASLDTTQKRLIPRWFSHKDLLPFSKRGIIMTLRH